MNHNLMSLIIKAVATMPMLTLLVFFSFALFCFWQKQ